MSKMRISRIIKIEEVEGYTCDLCSTGIKYKVTVEMEDGSIKGIGRDCASTHFGVKPCDKKYLRMTAKKYRDRMIYETKSTIGELEKSFAGAGESDSNFIPNWEKYLEAAKSRLAELED